MKIQKLFGINVKKIRTKKNLTQEKLAEITGLHRTYIGAVERGEKNISINNIEKIANALNIKMHELFKELNDHGRNSRC